MLTETEIESMSDEERARHLAEFESRLAASTERTRQENKLKAQQIKELEELVIKRRQLLEKMRQTVADIEQQDADIARDVERVLAKAA